MVRDHGREDAGKNNILHEQGQGGKNDFPLRDEMGEDQHQGDDAKDDENGEERFFHKKQPLALYSHM